MKTKLSPISFALILNSLMFTLARFAFSQGVSSVQLPLVHQCKDTVSLVRGVFCLAACGNGCRVAACGREQSILHKNLCCGVILCPLYVVKKPLYVYNSFFLFFGHKL